MKKEAGDLAGSAHSEDNFAGDALRVNTFTPYLPAYGYRDPTLTDKGDVYWADWKKRADAATTPAVIAAIHSTLATHGIIPAKERDFTMVSNGTFVPTYERLFFDLDRGARAGSTRVVAVDLQQLPADMLARMVVEEGKDSFAFVSSAEEDYVMPDGGIDMIWNFRASLYYYLRGPFHGAPELLDRAGDLLRKYHRALGESGCIVVDAPDNNGYFGKPPDTEMYNTTAELLEEFQDELGLESYFDLMTVGEGKARVMVLRKMPTRNSRHNLPK